MYSAVIVAAGSGTRFGSLEPKVLSRFGDKPLIQSSLERFLEDPDCLEIILVHSVKTSHEFLRFKQEKVILAIGGDTRQESVRLGLAMVKAPLVLIHDGARPNLSQRLLLCVKTALDQFSAVAPAIPVSDTLKECRGEVIIGDIDRETIRQIQTPQGFRTDQIRLAHALAHQAGRQYSDDTSVYQHELALPVMLVEGDPANIKVTTLTDILILEAIR